MRSALSLVVLALIVMGVAAASSQDITAEPNFGSLTLDEGFVPDPETVSVTSGGSVEVGVDGCSYGYVSSAPDVDVHYTTSGDSDLYFYVVGDGDTTLLVNTPNGDWVCDDDSYEDGDPILVLYNAPEGLYNVWAGSYSNDFHDATLFVSEIDPRGNTSSVLVPDEALEPTYGSETLNEGFLPDPYTVDLVARGSIDLDLGECTYGYVAEAPDFDLYYSGEGTEVTTDYLGRAIYETSGGSDLYIYALSEEDTMLLVNTPDGIWLCNDDGHYGSHPLIVVPSAAGGLYDIGVGSYDEDTAGATLYISEIDPR